MVNCDRTYVETEGKVFSSPEPRILRLRMTRWSEKLSVGEMRRRVLIAKNWPFEPLFTAPVRFSC